MATDTKTTSLHDATEGLMSVEYNNDCEYGVLVVNMPNRKRDITPLGAPLHEMRELVTDKFADARRAHKRAGTDFGLMSYWTLTEWAITEYIDGLAAAAADKPVNRPDVSGSFERAHQDKPRRVFSFGPVPVIRRPVAG